MNYIWVIYEFMYVFTTFNITSDLCIIMKIEIVKENIKMI
jgi:hypothetical protein